MTFIVNYFLSFLNSLKQLDYKLFSKVNGQWHNSFFDGLLPLTRETYFWIPFYLFLILFAAINFKRQGWFWVFFLIINVVLSDFISSTLIKDNFFRLRPCHDPLIADQVRFLVSYCPGSSSFTSSHACNFFAASMFIFATFKNVSKWRGLVFVWAFIPSYAQVYVGVHFPLDVICGMVVGLFSGFALAKIFNKKIGLLQPLEI